ncbi:ATP-binding cassette domain-containing protein [Streptococcus hyointestinalis]|uniref:ATP-binding cassette domain-containing protein n=1 Tax=Streptococcus hyointestinalis TaxID=1337 RepID=UPI0013E0EA1B|nr:ATP-binding cassette domain-containing protein [Streptococcus hyointestinalis]
MALLELKQVRKTFGHQTILHDVSLRVDKGDIYGLVGRNGAGKTTTLKIITDLIQADSGQVLLFSQEKGSQYNKALKRTSSMIEMPVAFDHLSAKDNLLYYCKLRGIVNAPKVIQETLDLVGLKDTGRKPYKKFSLGMKQKLGLAIALLSKPDLVILDEPLNGLDPIAIIDLRKLILKLNEELGITFIISSHILSELFLVATKFGIIHDGEVKRTFTKEEFNRMNQEYIVVESSNTAAITYLLEQKGIHDFKVVNEEVVNIFTADISIKTIAAWLLSDNLDFDGLYYHRQDLEAYFNDIVHEKA